MSREEKLQSNWFVYILRCGDGSLYTGVTTDPQRRLRQHRGDIKGGARYTRARLPVDMVYLESQPNRSDATRREAAIKRLKAKDKELLIFNQVEPENFSSLTTQIAEKNCVKKNLLRSNTVKSKP